MQITYTNKEALQNDPEVADKNKVTADDMNEIKTVVNTNEEELSAYISDLENNQLTGQSSGTSIDLSDSADSRVRSIELEGNSEQESTTGKNLFDKEAAAIRSGTEKIVLDTGIRVKQTVDGQFKYLAIKIGGSELLGKQITFGGKITPSASNLGCVYLYYGNQNNTTVTPGNVSVIGSGNKSATATLLNEFPANCDTVWLLLYSNRDGTGNINDYIDYTDFMFVIGSTLGEYEPYTGGQASPNPSYPQEIHSTGDSGSVNEKVQNKNLWNSELEKAEYDTSGNKTTTNVWVVNIQKITVEPNTHYIVSQKERPSQYRILFFENDTFISRSDNTQNTTTGYTSYTFNTPENCNKIYIQFRSTLEVIAKGSYDMTPTDITDVQLEQGTTATDYIVHEEQNITIPTQQPMRAIGEYKDTFVKVDENWYERHYIGQKIFNGGADENWKLWDIQATNVQRFYIVDIINSKGGSNLLCSHFKVILNDTDVPHCRLGGSSYSEFIVYINRTITTVEQFKTWLSNNNVEVIYVLATPVDLPCTEEQTEALESLEKARTYKPVTHISSEDTVPATIDLTYVKDLETVINNLS